MKNVYLFQGNPKIYDVDGYLTTHPYIYWRCPTYRNRINIGDVAILWRSGKNAGMIAIGEIAEVPTQVKNIKHPELLGHRYWFGDEVKNEDDVKVGIKIYDVRLCLEDGFVSREQLKVDKDVGSHRIITNPTGTVFYIEDLVAKTMLLAWSGLERLESTDVIFDIMPSGLEGESKLALHLKRERSSSLRKAKVDNFFKLKGSIHCELCEVSLDNLYPARLASGFIEVHHIRPISSLAESSPTTLEELMLLCPNCHRMVHRTKEAEKNLVELKEWFADRNKK